MNLVSVQSPPAIVRQLRADEQVLHSESGARFVVAARDRQALLHALGKAPKTAAAVIRLRPSERDDIQARLDIQKLHNQTPPLKHKLRFGPAAPQERLLTWYREAQRRFGVRWQVLAAINLVESDFNRVRNTSVAGAQGPMQFEPATWAAYGLGGNVHDPHDAILGAAHYLAANRGATDERNALYHYNPSTLYVDAVEHYAHRIATVTYALSEYYSWAP